MRKAVNRHFLEKIAEMYYIRGLSQKEIADEYCFSRSNISRYLKQCEQEGIVEVKINRVRPYLENMAKRIMDKYGLDYVRVLSHSEDIDLVKKEVCDEAARYLDGLLDDDINIGLSWGSTLNEVVRVFPTPEKQWKRIAVHQLLGGDGDTEVDDDSPQLTKTFGMKIGAQVYVMNAPLMVQSPVLKDLLLKEPSIEEHFRRLENLDIVLMGIGSVNYEQNAMLRAGRISRDDAESLLNQGAVADLCGHAIDSDGLLCNAELSRQMMLLDMDHILRTDIRLGVAFGQSKIEPVKAVLKSSYLTSLIIDESIGEKL